MAPGAGREAPRSAHRATGERATSQPSRWWRWRSQERARRRGGPRTDAAGRQARAPLIRPPHRPARRRARHAPGTRVRCFAGSDATRRALDRTRRGRAGSRSGRPARRDHPRTTGRTSAGHRPKRIAGYRERSARDHHARHGTKRLRGQARDRQKKLRSMESGGDHAARRGHGAKRHAGEPSTEGTRRRRAAVCQRARQCGPSAVDALTPCSAVHLDARSREPQADRLPLSGRREGAVRHARRGDQTVAQAVWVDRRIQERADQVHGARLDDVREDGLDQCVTGRTREHALQLMTQWMAGSPHDATVRARAPTHGGSASAGDASVPSCSSTRIRVAASTASRSGATVAGSIPARCVASKSPSSASASAGAMAMYAAR
jgi:hypothetical protein